MLGYTGLLSIIIFLFCRLGFVIGAESMNDAAKNTIFKNLNRNRLTEPNNKIFSLLLRKSNTLYFCIPIILAVFYIILKCVKSLKNSKTRRLSNNGESDCESDEDEGAHVQNYGQVEHVDTTEDRERLQQRGNDKLMTIIITALVTSGYTMMMALIAASLIEKLPDLMPAMLAFTLGVFCALLLKTFGASRQENAEGRDEEEDVDNTSQDGRNDGHTKQD